jgi:spermidine synthase
MRRPKFLLLLFCFFLSGGAGLIYQVAWTKALGLVFGHTVYAITTVLAAFMGGLAAGYAFLGRWGERHRNPVALFGKIEILIGATGALSLVGLSTVRSLYLAAHQLAPDSTLFLVALRFFASVLVLLPPTFLMGGTLPILTAGVTRTSAELGTRLSRLYWINTAGAVIGVVAAGFVLLPEIGLRLTLLVAVALNLVGGSVALAVSRGREELPAIEEAEASGKAASGGPRFLLASFALVGATAMIYEVAWSRLLATPLGSSTYAFTIMLATFLAGIALGGRLFEIWVTRRPNVSLATFAATQTVTGVTAVFCLAILQILPAILWAVVTATDKTFAGLVVAQFATAALAMFPTAIAFGFNFPLVILLIARSKGANPSSRAVVGRGCAANTVGAILGAVAAGFWLVPKLGSFRLLALTAAANFALATFLFARHMPRRRVLVAGNVALAISVAVVGWFQIFHNQAIAHFGVLTNRSSYASTLRLDEAAHATDLVFAEDGLNASIAIVRTSEFLALRTNGKVDASTSDTLSQLMVGHLGAIFHRAPKRVLIIGFGSGMTVSAVARYPDVERIDCVEIEPAVLHAAAHLEPLNRNVLADPRVRIIVNDARNFLFTTQDQYDLIISEPSNPWIAGVASLFTDEFYREVRSHLAPGGMLVQWLQAYSIFPDDLTMALATLAGQFPAVTAWRGEWADIVLLAQSQPGPLTLDRLHKYWSVPLLREDYSALGLKRPEGLNAYHLLDDPDVRKLAANAVSDTDDLTRLEYRAPRALLAKVGRANVEMLTHQRSSLRPASIPVTDARLALIGTAETLAFLEEREREGEILSALARDYPPFLDSELLRAKWLATSNKPQEARKAFENARRLAPSALEPLLGLAEVARSEKDYATAEGLLHEILMRDPQFVPALESYARLERSRGHSAEAVEWQTKRVAADPHCPLGPLALLADMLFFEAGDTREAARVAEALLDRDPYNGTAHRILGEIRWRESRWEEARSHLESVVRYYPAWIPGVYSALANVYRNLDRSDDADFIVRKAARIFPGNADLAPTGQVSPVFADRPRAGIGVIR